MLTTKWKVLLLGLLLAVAVWRIYSWGYADAEIKANLAWTEHVAEDEKNARIAQEQQRQREQSFNLVREEQEAVHAAGVLTLRTSNDNLARVNDGLQQQVTRTQRTLSSARETARIAGINEGAIKTALVYSKLFGEAAEELQRVAGTADEWYLKATSCQQFYEKVRSQ